MRELIWGNQGENKEIWGKLQKKIRTFGEKFGKFGKIRGNFPRKFRAN